MGYLLFSVQSTMVPSEQGQQCREPGRGGKGTKKISVSLQTERRQQERESLLLGTRTGFDIEVKCLENTILD